MNLPCKWCLVRPKDTHMGTGIIVDVVDTHPDLVNIGYSIKSYVVQTDFGNIVTLTYEELSTAFYLVGVCDDPLGRMFDQKRNLAECMDKYYDCLIN